MGPSAINGFVVYPTYRIIENKAYVYLFGRLENSESFLTISRFRPYFYIRREDLTKALELENFEYEETSSKNFEGEDMVKVVLDVPTQVKPLREKLESRRIRAYEADIRFVIRFLIDHGIRGTLAISGSHKKGDIVDRIYEDPQLGPAPPDYFPKLKTFSFDIETDLEGTRLLCVSAYTEGFSESWIIGKEKLKHAVSCADEKELLERFFACIKEQDPDIITGWNIIDFDLAVIRDRAKAAKVPLMFGRPAWECKLRIEESFFIDSKADVPGRMVLDGIHLLKGSFVKMADYKLNTAAKRFLGKEKLLVGEGRHAEIQELYKHDQQKLVDYNLLDAQLAYEIIMKSDTLSLSVQRSMLTGMQLDRVNASVASLDFVYLSEARKRGLVTTSSGYAAQEERIKGGFVMESKPGIYEYVLVLDFKSLYPSIMRTFNIDPYAFVDKRRMKEHKKEDLIITPNGTAFRREPGILPDLIQRLWERRDKAKKEKNKLASNAIKILMNSFFGVLANPTCRFYNLDMANAITQTGQHIIKLTAKKIQEQGFTVIYGDTDSIFVLSGATDEHDAARVGNRLQDHINTFYKGHIQEEYRRESFLELEFEKIYKKFLMPRIRGAEEGAKKRYAGLLVKDGKESMDFVGLEVVRRDWTELAKKFQTELLEKIFKGEEVASYVRQFVEDVRKGKHDSLLVYRKAIRKEMADYTKTTPPHVKAARQLERLEGNIIEYCMTVDGPQPVQKLKSSLDYDHYIEKQIKPIADAVLSFQNQSFEDILKNHKQRSLADFH
jgi:DNA polymerase-2